MNYTAKLPKPAIETTAFSRDSSTHPYYTEAQLKQYGDDRARDAMEEIANLYSPDDTASDYINKIHALAKEIK